LGQGVRADPTPRDVARAVEQLGSPKYRLRQKASAYLWAAGKAAEPALRQALRSKDPEVARRARAILDKFQYGIFPNTPRQVLDLIYEFRSGDDSAKYRTIQALNKLGAPGHAVLIKLAGLEHAHNVRNALFICLNKEVVPGLLASGRYDEVEELLELALKGGDEQAMRNLAAFLALSGRADDRIPVWAKKAKKLTGSRDGEVLMYIYRAKGDLKNARRLAARTGKKGLETSILIEQADWKELAGGDYGPASEAPDTLVALAYKAAYNRLAGNTKEFEKALADLLKLDLPSPYYFKRKAYTLLLNNRPREAIDLLVKNGQTSLAFTLLAAQHRYREAFELADKAKATRDAQEVFQLKLATARTHAVLGDREQAGKILDKLADEYFTPNRAAWAARDNYSTVIDTERELGFIDQALAHCARILPREEKLDQLPKLFGQVFTDRGNEALVWWKFFRQKHPRDKIEGGLKRLREVFEKKLSARDFTALAKELEKAAANLANKDEQGRWFGALGETCLVYGETALGQGYLEKAGTADALIQLGHSLAEKKQWARAAERYGQAWAEDRSRPLPLYLKGRALVQAGKKKEGEKWMRVARMLPLAEDRKRFQLAQDLDKQGLKEEAERELELITRSARFHYVEMSNALNYLRTAAFLKKDYRRALDYHERNLLSFLDTLIFIRAEAYLRVPAFGHYFRAESLLAAGRVDEALKEADLALVGMPGNIETVIYLVPSLNRHKHKKEADALFARVFEHYEKVLKAYPKSAQNHNTLAWMAVCCRRQLDKALEHSKKAVELAPTNAGYLDTLAEVSYQRGDKAEAIRLMKKCIAMDPKHAYFRKQIKRFEAPGPPSETPRTN
jgi:tetratricopeptide (TPR) repeat protein